MTNPPTQRKQFQVEFICYLICGSCYDGGEGKLVSLYTMQSGRWIDLSSIYNLTSLEYLWVTQLPQTIVAYYTELCTNFDYGEHCEVIYVGG